MLDRNLTPKLLRYVQVSSALAKRALDELGQHRDMQKQAAEMQPALLTQMIEAKAVGEHQKEAAQKMLGNHTGTLQLLKSAIDRISELSKNQSKQAGDLGEGVDAEKAGLDTGETQDSNWSLESGYVGEKTAQKKASDEAILKVLDAPGV